MFQPAIEGLPEAVARFGTIGDCERELGFQILNQWLQRVILQCCAQGGQDKFNCLKICRKACYDLWDIFDEMNIFQQPLETMQRNGGDANDASGDAQCTSHDDKEQL